eukprot:scaffold53079_cov70-Phaeocystis_antarctica.AAC.5
MSGSSSGLVLAIVGSSWRGAASEVIVHERVAPSWLKPEGSGAVHGRQVSAESLSTLALASHSHWGARHSRHAYVSPRARERPGSVAWRDAALLWQRVAKPHNARVPSISSAVQMAPWRGRSLNSKLRSSIAGSGAQYSKSVNCARQRNQAQMHVRQVGYSWQAIKGKRGNQGQSPSGRSSRRDA